MWEDRLVKAKPKGREESKNAIVNQKKFFSLLLTTPFFIAAGWIMVSRLVQ